MILALCLHSQLSENDLVKYIPKSLRNSFNYGDQITLHDNYRVEKPVQFSSA